MTGGAKRVRFCPAGHDTTVVGRTLARTCRACMREMRRKYRRSRKGRQAAKRYKRGIAGQAARRRANKSPARRRRSARYRASLRGMLTNWKSYSRSRRTSLRSLNEAK